MIHWSLLAVCFVSFVVCIIPASLWYTDAFARVNPDKNPLNYSFLQPGTGEMLRSNDPVVRALLKKWGVAFALSLFFFLLTAGLMVTAPALKILTKS